MARSLYFVLIMSLLSCSGLKNSKEEKRAEIYFAQGTRSLIKKDFTNALINLKKAKELSPRRSDIFNNLGMAYYFKGKKKTAASNIKRAIQLDSKNTEARSNLASIYVEANKLKSARKLYIQILDDLTYKKQDQTYYNLGVIDLKVKNTRRAMSYFKKSVSKNQFNCNAHFQLGTHYLKANHLQEAKKHFAEGSDGPCFKMQASHYYLGLTNMKLGNYERAYKDFSLFTKRFPKSKYVNLAKRKIASMNQPASKSEDTFENVIYSRKNGLIEFE